MPRFNLKLVPTTSTVTRWSTGRSRAVAAGFRAVKAEVTLERPYAHTGLREPWYRSTEVLAACGTRSDPTPIML